MDGLLEDESCRFRSYKSVEEEEDALLSQSKPKSTQYGDKLSVKFFRYWRATGELIYFQKYVIG